MTKADAVLEHLNTAAVGLAVWSAKQESLFCNRPFRHAFGMADGDVAVGSRYTSFLRHLVRSSELVLASPGAAWIETEVARFGREATTLQPMADGRTLEIIQRPSEHGGMVVTVQDVTARQRSEQQLRRAKELAEATDQTKSRFLRAANHDLRQPLATLKILIFNCVTEDDPGHRRDLLHAMDIAVSIMEDLLGALLQIGQLDAGRILPRVTTFQVLPLLQRLELQFRHQAEEKGLTLRVVGACSSLATDKALLERILANLVANAVRYTEVGKVLIGCRRVGSSLRVEVWDSGRGIGPEHQERIFDEFYQVADRQRLKKSGLGLGLNIAKRLADLLELELTVRSVPGKGSVFAVAVPLGNVWHSDAGEPEISEMIGGEFAGTSVILIEDDDVLLDAMRELLERWGILVHAVDAEAQARELVISARVAPGLIIADYSLRGQQGTHVVRHLWGLLGRQVPTIIVTADNEPALIREIKGQGFPVLIKPVSPPRLRVLMHNLLFEPQLLAPLAN